MSWDWEKLKDQQSKSGGGGGGGAPPQIDDLLNKIKSFKFGGGPIIILILILLFFGSTMFYKVGIDEVAVVQRFGKYVRTSQPGLRFKLPEGIEKKTLIKVKRVYKEEFGFKGSRTGDSRSFSSGAESSANVSLMLTGDLNVAVVPWIVQYRINDPVKYLFEVHNPQKLLNQMSEAAMRLVVGDRSIDEVISKRKEIADEAQGRLQKELNEANSGIKIVTLEMKRTNVPGPVQPSFNEVNQAVQEKEKLIYEAKEDYNKAIPAARGTAERTIKYAEGYAIDRVNRSQGDVSRFLAIYKEYAKARDITKRRLYLEMLEELYPKLDQKYIIDSDQKSVLPLLNLEKGIGGK
ncbi:FtsH protease activity modulator HflK [Desulfococcaceae bacterium HSG7]|nr:FtsH protease activity modulator HflK [Desulfococcaceae bacterium HSG9]MDM8556766.1 FtsH protease activity modulator HflK [Desulfococcaceae bacterium HSG7]